MNKNFSLAVAFAAGLSIISSYGVAQSAADNQATTHHHSSHHEGHQQAKADVMITDVVVREMIPGTQSTAGYFTLTNHSSQAVSLVSVTSRAFKKVEIHEHVMKDGMMSMQQVQKDIVIEPHQSVKFMPGGYHLMLFNPKQKIRKGTKVTLEFKLEGAVDVATTAKVISVLEQQKLSTGDHSHHH